MGQLTKKEPQQRPSIQGIKDLYSQFLLGVVKSDYAEFANLSHLTAQLPPNPHAIW